jgi:hypothetical protein
LFIQRRSASPADKAAQVLLTDIAKERTPWRAHSKADLRRMADQMGAAVSATVHRRSERVTMSLVTSAKAVVQRS